MRNGRAGAVQHRAVAVCIAHARELDIAATVKLNIAALGLGRIQNAKHAARGGHAVHGRVEQRSQAAHGQKELLRQKDDEEGSLKADLARGELQRGYDNAERGAHIDDQVHNANGAQLHHQQVHGRCAETLGLGVDALVPASIGLVDLKGGETLHGLQEHAAKIDIAAPVLGTDLFGVAHDHHNGDGDDRNAGEQQRGGKTRLAHEQYKQRDGCQAGKEELRQVAAKVHLELRGALDAGLDGLGGGDGLGVGGAECGELVVDERAHAADGLERGLVAGALGQVDGGGAHDDGGGERQGRLCEGIDGERGGKAVRDDAAQDARKHPHHRDVCHERDPLKQDACHNVGRCLRNQGEEPLLEHETSYAVTVPGGVLGSRLVSQMQLE